MKKEIGPAEKKLREAMDLDPKFKEAQLKLEKELLEEFGPFREELTQIDVNYNENLARKRLTRICRMHECKIKEAGQLNQEVKRLVTEANEALSNLIKVTNRKN